MEIILILGISYELRTMGILFRKIMQTPWDVSLEILADCARIGAKTKTRIEVMSSPQFGYSAYEQSTARNCNKTIGFYAK